MTFSQITIGVSRTLNRVMFGSGIAKCEDFNSQFEMLGWSYLANLVAISIVCFGAAALLGTISLLHPFADSNASKTVMAYSNAVTFFLTFIASLSWRLHPSSRERLLKAKRSLASFLFSILVMGSFAAFFLAILFKYFEVPALLAGIATNCFLLLSFLSYQEMKERGEP